MLFQNYFLNLWDVLIIKSLQNYRISGMKKILGIISVIFNVVDVIYKENKVIC